MRDFLSAAIVFGCRIKMLKLPNGKPELLAEVADLKLQLARAKKDLSNSSKSPSSDIVKPPKVYERYLLPMLHCGIIQKDCGTFFSERAILVNANHHLLSKSQTSIFPFSADSLPAKTKSPRFFPTTNRVNW